MWTSPNLETKSQLLRLERPLKYSLHETWDLPLWSAKSHVQVPSPISNAKSRGIFWVLKSPWKYILTLFSSLIPMDERRQYILVVLALHGYKTIICCFIGISTNYYVWINVELMLMAIFILERGRMNTPRSFWKYEGVGGYAKKSLLNSYLENMFKKRMRVNLPLFKYLCIIHGLVLGNLIKHD